MSERSVLIRLKANASDFNRGMVEAAAAVGELRKEIDTTSDRTAWLAQGILALAPAAVRLGAGAVPAVAGLTTQLTFAVGAAGTAALAFHGVGDALKALNDYQVEPTAEHLQKLHEQMAKIGPDGAQFVRFIDSLQPQLAALSNTARAGMFPGMEDGISHLLTLMPQVKTIISNISSAMGDLSAEAGKNLAGPKFKAFFQYLETDAKPTLIDLGRTVGNFAEGIANMFVAFGPESAKFSDGLLGMSRAFAEWSRNLDQNEGFQHFLDYVDQSGPQALDFLGSLIQTVDALVRALAPVGQVSLPLLTDVLQIITKIVDTPLGPAILGVASLASTYGRLKAIYDITGGGLTQSLGRFENGVIRQTKAVNLAVPSMRQFGNTLLHSMHSQDQLNEHFATGAQKAIESRNAVKGFASELTRLAPAGIALGSLALIASGTSDKLGITNTASLTLAGTMIGPVGTALGFTAGAFLDTQHAAENYQHSLETVTTASATANARQLEQLKIQAQAIYDQRSWWGKAMNQYGNWGEARIADVQSLLGGVGRDLRQSVDPFAHYDQGHRIKTVNHDLSMLANTMATIDGRARLIGTPSRNGLLLLTDQLGYGSHAAHLLAASMADVQKAFITMTDALEKRSSIRDFSAAIDDAAAALKKNGKGLDPFSAVGPKQRAANRENQAALDNILTTAIQVAGHLKGMDRERFLYNARDDFVKAAEGFGLTERAAEKLANQLDVIQRPHKVNADTGQANHNLDVTAGKAAALSKKPFMLTVNANASQSLRTLRAVYVELASLRSKTITVTTMHATGGSVKAGYKTGGFTGWGGHDEPAGVVHRNELVIPEHYVMRDWSMLKARYGDLPGFADGGLVRATYAGSQPAARGASGPHSMAVDFGDLRVHGTLNTPWGREEITGLARAVSRQEIQAQRDFEEQHLV